MKIPFRCPVCGGNGLVPNGFYRQTSGGWLTEDTALEPCRSCGGTGIVYAEQDETFEMKVEMREDETNDFKFE